jgi:hypothetical protein
VSLEASAQVTDLTVHDHACLTFGEAEELADLTAAFVRDGLAGGSRVVWLSDTPHEAAAELDRRGLGSAALPVRGTAADGIGPITVVDGKECLTAGQAFEVERAVGWLREQVVMTQREGYDGLRIALDMGWAAGCGDRAASRVRAGDRRLGRGTNGRRPRGGDRGRAVGVVPVRPGPV